MPWVTEVGRIGALMLVGLASPPLSAQTAAVGGIAIQHPWMRATPNGAQVAGGYLTITNRGAEADTLTGGSLEAAATFEVHDMSSDNGVMKMRPAGPVTIQPGSSMTFTPGGRHIMFTGLAHTFKKGETVAGTLVFTHAGTVPVRFAVEGIGAKMPSMPSMPGMN